LTNAAIKDNKGVELSQPFMIGKNFFYLLAVLQVKPAQGGQMIRLKGLKRIIFSY